MPEYDIKFSQNLAELAVALVGKGLETPEARRTVIYLSRLSIELSLKALLELGGKPISEIRSHSHKLKQLLTEVEGYQFEMDGKWHPGSEVRDLHVQYGGHRINMAVIIEAEDHGVSKFPDGIRYGENVQDIFPEILAPASFILVTWAQKCQSAAPCKPCRPTSKDRSRAVAT